MPTKTRKIGPLSIFSIERLTLSSNGNPRFVLHTSQGDFRTQADASLSYGIENYTNARYPDTHVIGTDAGVPDVVLVATPTGRVWGIEKDGKLMH